MERTVVTKAMMMRIEKMIEMQAQSVDKLEKAAEANQRKGELIYENYQEHN